MGEGAGNGVRCAAIQGVMDLESARMGAGCSAGQSGWWEVRGRVYGNTGAKVTPDVCNCRSDSRVQCPGTARALVEQA